MLLYKYKFFGISPARASGIQGWEKEMQKFVSIFLAVAGSAMAVRYALGFAEPAVYDGAAKEMMYVSFAVGALLMSFLMAFVIRKEERVRERRLSKR